MSSSPKEAMMGLFGAGMRSAQLLLRVKDSPESVFDLQKRAAKLGAVIRQCSFSAVPGEDFAVFNAFVEVSTPSTTAEKMAAALAKSPYVLEAKAAEGREYGVLDTLAFPVSWGGKRLVFMNQRAIAGVFDGIQKTFGSGGDVILYQAGMVYGREFQEGIIRTVGRELLLEDRGYPIKIMAAAGWGIPEVSQVDPGSRTGVIRVRECFECAGTKSKRAVCSFVRGVLVGSTETLFGGTAAADETSCIARGDPYCEFEIRRKP